MRVAVGADHAGYPLKQLVAEALRQEGHQVLDLGAHSTEPSDYPLFAKAVGEAVRSGRADRAVLACGSSAGACVAANKLRGIRAATAHDCYTAVQMVEHDDVNVCCLGARVIGPELALTVVRAFLSAEFSGEERHRRRLAQLAALEEEER